MFTEQNGFWLPEKTDYRNASAGVREELSRIDHKHKLDLTEYYDPAGKKILDFTSPNVTINAGASGSVNLLGGSQVALDATSAAGGSVYIKPGSTGRLNLGNRNGYLPLSNTTYTLPANVNVPKGAGVQVIPLASGIVLDLIAGDRVSAMFQLLCQPVVASNVSYNYWVAYLAGAPTTYWTFGFGRPGFVYEGHAWTTGKMTVPTTGTYTFIWTAVTDVGNMDYLGGFTSMTVDVWGIR